jgi:tetratricopeptide (TPR) repeat protein
MKNTLLLLGLLVIPSLVGFGVCWQRARSFPRFLGEARAALGTRRGSGLLEQVAQLYPENAEVHFLYARHLRLEGKTDQAQAHLAQAAELGWEQASLQREQVLLAAQSDFYRAEPQLQNWLNDDPDDREVLLALAQGYFRAQRFKKAEAFLQQILNVDAADAPALSLRGQIRFETRRLREARQDLEKAVELGPHLSSAFSTRTLLAACLLDLGQFAEALTHFRQCLTEDPNNPKILFAIGRCALYLNDMNGAQEMFEAALRLQPDFIEARLQLASIHEQRGELSKALEQLRQVEQRDPDLRDLLFRMAKILHALGQPERAAVYQKRYDEIRSRRPEPHASPERTDAPDTPTIRGKSLPPP